MRISDWSSDVCSSDLALAVHAVQKISERIAAEGIRIRVTGSAQPVELVATCGDHMAFVDALVTTWRAGLLHHSLQSLLEAGLDERIKMTVEHLLRVGNFDRSEEHTSELQSLMRTSYAVFCLKKKNE